MSAKIIKPSVSDVCDNVGLEVCCEGVSCVYVIYAMYMVYVCIM